MPTTRSGVRQPIVHENPPLSPADTARQTTEGGTADGGTVQNTPTDLLLQGSSTEVPLQSTTTEVPLQSTTTAEPPRQGGATRLPLQGGTTESPRQGGATRLPLQGGTTKPPLQGGTTRPPLQGGPTEKSSIAQSRRSSRKDHARRLTEAAMEVAKLKLDLATARLKAIENEYDTDEDFEDDCSQGTAGARHRVQTWFENNDKSKKQVQITENQKTEDSNKIDLTDLAAAIAKAARSDTPSRTPGCSRYFSDLPIFNGSHLDWLAFRAAYRETASLYSNVENSARLRKALRGRAKEAVACLLIANACPQEILSTLETRFGRPDSIAITEIERLRSLPRLTDAPKDVCLFANKITNSIKTLEVLDRKHYLYNPELVKNLVEKLTPTLRYRWYDYATDADDNEPDLQKFCKFMTREAERCGKFAPPEIVHNEDTPSAPRHYRAQKSYHTDKTEGDKCDVCKKQRHHASECDVFKKADSDGRWDLAKSHRLCFRCLKRKTMTHRCPTKKCEENGCERTHHRMLHHNRGPPTDKKEIERVTSTYSTRNIATYLKIVPIRVSGPDGYFDTFALLDDGSTLTLVDTDTALRVGADGPLDPLCIEAIAGTTVERIASRRITLTIRGQFDEYEIRARTIDKLQLSGQSIDIKDLQDCSHLFGLEDILTYDAGRPTVLIGQDNWHLLLASEVRRGTINQPAASLTPLGWVLHGTNTRAMGHRVHYVNHLFENNSDDDLNEAMKRHFSLDSVGIEPRRPRSDPEERAMKILKEKTVETASGGYSTALLWKTDKVTLPNNYEDAYKRLQSIEKKLERDGTRAAYEQQIEKLIEKSYAEPATAPPTPGRTWYLPHFAVTHPAKPDKLRVVYDAAARCKGTSLNDQLLPGPDLLQSLPGVLMRFRQHSIAVAADIEEMFLRVGIIEEDRDALRFLWRPHRREGPPQEYRMKSVIFGAACSPCSALYVKNMNAELHAAQYPEAAQAIVIHHYMDDYLQSFEDTETALKVTKEVNEIHKKANFHLRKWTSNSPDLLAAYTETEESIERQLSDGTREEKILGLTWRPHTDTLGFNLNFARVAPSIATGERTPTKREALRTAMSLFDPTGLLSPITIQAKKILQETWRAGTEWDKPLPDHLHAHWRSWLEHLQQIKGVNLPRCHPYLSRDTSRELHTFVDASETAYAAAVYWRTTDSEGQVYITLAAAKARVAPLKLTSIPRLELQAALLGSRLARTTEEEYQLKPACRHFWSDSKTALAWLRTGPRAFKPFVAHRVAEIEENTTVKEWHWVPTQQNPADDATRDVPKNFNQQHRWFTGPEFLYLPAEQWPEEKTEATQQTGEERTHIAKEQTPKLTEALPAIDRFSSWLRLIRATGRVLQFVDLLKKKRTQTVNSYKRTARRTDSDPTWGKPSKKKAAPSMPRRRAKTDDYHTLDAEFIKQAMSLWESASQQDSFGTEIDALRQGDNPARDSRLRSLAIYLDEDGKIKLKSRVAAADDITDEQREPVVLDGDHAYTRLYIAWTHKQLMHGGTELIVNEVRQHYYVLRLRPIARTVVKSCQQCRMKRAQPAEPPTGNHPRTRLAHHHRAFTYTGLDYFGPLSVTVGRQHQRRYVALFTCLTTRAVHLEVAASLSADSAIMALRRMIARRGSPTEIHSDNGTNMHGADRELREALREEAASRGIVWRYIPPGAPFMGGAWERLVKSVKTALSTVLCERHPHEETLTTLLCEAEYTVNSRPLTHVSIEPGDHEALTPNHFLIGGSGRVRAPGAFSDADLNNKQHWRRAQRLADMFWGRWLREYLPELQYRREPCGRGDPLQIGDLVLIIDATLPRNTWPRGRVIAVHPGPDGVVRVADVQTKGGVLRRPIKKLVFLPGTRTAADPAPEEDAAPSHDSSPGAARRENVQDSRTE